MKKSESKIDKKPRSKVTKRKPASGKVVSKGSGIMLDAVPKYVGEILWDSEVVGKKKPETEGYKRNKGGIYVRTGSIVEPTAIKKGLEKAKEQLRSMIDEFSQVLILDGHTISEIELSVSFDASGKFLGVGIGGATSIKIKIVPSQS